MNQMQSMPITRTVKWLVIINVAVWFFGVWVAQRFFLPPNSLFALFGLIPVQTLEHFWLWQPVTYMFLHASNPMHILFNMLTLWMFGSELEMKWGRQFFLSYYFICGIGAAILYVVALATYCFFSHDMLPLGEPVVGASGAIYGLLVAYGMIYGDRQIHFMMLFPMKAKHFVMVIGFVEFFTLMDSGPANGVANLAHLGGIVVGYLFLKFWTDWRFRMKRKPGAGRGRRLKLVVNNENAPASESQPRYWN
jgi:membrane associated rhomboid family serine protease